MGRTKTKIINHTNQVADVIEGGPGYLKRVSKQLVSPHECYNVSFDPNATYREWEIRVGDQPINITTDDFFECYEIVIYETIDHKVAWRMSKQRDPRRAKPSPSTKPQPSVVMQPLSRQDLAAFNALRTDASSRIGNVKTGCGSLEKLLILVKICPSQCKNLIKTCLEVSMKLTEKYNYAVPENEMYELFLNNKLSQLIGSLDRHLSTLGSIKGLLQACGREWCKMGLVLSVPPCEKKTLSKFGLLNDELCLNLDVSYYALHLKNEMEFQWNESMCRYMLVKKDSMTSVAAVGELTESERLDYERQDRHHFLSRLKDQSLLAQEKNSWIRRFTRQNDSQAIHKFAAVLKKRMQQVCDLSKDTCSDQSFSRIEHSDLKTKNKLSGESTRLVYKGEWCGQVVAIGISIGVTEAAVKSEAALMLKVQHPHIVEFYGWAFTEKAPPPASSGKDDEVSAGYLVMELMERDLRREIDRCKRSRERSVGPFPLAVAVDILLQIVGGMIHMHNLGIMHRDLKAANCLVSLRSSLKSSAEVLDFYTVKLIDFGDSKVLKAEMTVQTVNKGTRWWMAPEVWQVEGEQLKQYTKTADVYSFGVTCYEVITGLVPFEEFRHSPSSLIQALKEGTRPRIPPTCPAGFQQLMSKCWAQVPDARPNFKDIQKELWTIKGSLEQWN